MTNKTAIELLPCPFCGNEPERQHFNISPHLPGRIICSCGAEMRQGRNQTSAELVGAWNARTCGEEGAVPMTEENMSEHGWVRERTCRPSGEWKSISKTQEVRHVSCSECGHEFGMERRYDIPFERTLIVELPNFCPNCGAEVIGA